MKTTEPMDTTTGDAPSRRRRRWWRAPLKYILSAMAMLLLLQHVLTADPAPAQQAPAEATAPALERPADPNEVAIAPVTDEPAPSATETGDITLETTARMLGRGFVYTMIIAVGSITLGFLLAIPAGVVLNRNQGLLYLVIRSVVDFLRGTPVMVQLFFVYGFLWSQGIQVLPVTAAVLTLSINAMAYMAEVVRSGLMSVDPGQGYAGRALGLSKWQVFILVIWPQAFRIAIPPLVNSVVALIKDTALVSIIGVAEVVQAAQRLQSITYDASRYYFIVAVMFFCVTFPLMKLAGVLERKLREKGFA
ncbi:MAG: amino acid ABC transporter permease [Phycisphaerae bacterium]